MTNILANLFNYFWNVFEFYQGGDIEKATDWIFNNPGASASADMDTATSNTTSVPADSELPDGGGS